LELSLIIFFPIKKRMKNISKNEQHEICKKINRITIITPEIYSEFKSIYETKGTLTVDEIYHVLKKADDKNRRRLFQNEIKKRQSSSMKQKKKVHFQDEMENQPQEEIFLYSNVKIKIPEWEFIYEQSRMMEPSLLETFHQHLIRSTARQLKPLLLKIISSLSFQQYNRLRMD